MLAAFLKTMLTLKGSLGHSPTKSCDSASSEPLKATPPAFPPAPSLALPSISTHTDWPHPWGTYSYPHLTGEETEVRKWSEKSWHLANVLPACQALLWPVLAPPWRKASLPFHLWYDPQPRGILPCTVCALFMLGEGNKWAQRTQGRMAVGLRSCIRRSRGRHLPTTWSLCWAGWAGIFPLQTRTAVEPSLCQGPRGSWLQPLFPHLPKILLKFIGFCGFQWGLCWLYHHSSENSNSTGEFYCNYESLMVYHIRYETLMGLFSFFSVQVSNAVLMRHQ